MAKRGRRGNQEGTIMKRADGRWHGRLTVVDGKRKHIYGKTRQEVARRMVELQHELDIGLPILDERQTVGQFLESWIEVARSQVRGSSWRRYGDYVRVHLVPGLGRIPLAKLTRPADPTLLCPQTQRRTVLHNRTSPSWTAPSGIERCPPHGPHPAQRDRDAAITASHDEGNHAAYPGAGSALPQCGERRSL